MNKLLFSLLIVVSVAGSARDQINIVGSSTVYPFSTKVAEEFGRSSDFATPVVESTGTGGGMKLFCSGLGENTPDIANASRKIKKSEIQLCDKNGVNEIIELLVGYDGIVIANAKGGKKFKLTTRDLFLGLAKKVPAKRPGKLQDNPYNYWNEVNPSLPNVEIRIYGPPLTSGTRDAFNESVMEHGCREIEWIKKLINKNAQMFRQTCHTIRDDGRFIEAGENDNLIIRKLAADPNSQGIFGYSFLEQNSHLVQAASMNGSYPTFESIESGVYPVSRPLYFYVKKQHIGSIAGIVEYMNEFTSQKAMGEDGYLIDKGMIPLSQSQAQQSRVNANSLESLPF